MNIERVPDSGSLVLFAAEPVPEIGELVVLGDDIDAVFSGDNKLLKVTFKPVDHMPGEVVDVFGAVLVDAKQLREIALLRIQWDDQRFETRASVCDGEVRGGRRLADAAGLAVSAV